MVLNRIRKEIEVYINILAKPIAKTGISPTFFTVSGIVLSFIGFILLASVQYNPQSASNFMLVSIVVFLVSFIFDGIDGAIARISGKVSSLGAFLDSLSDRVCESFLLLGLIAAGFANSILCAGFLATSLIISYCRARGESLGVKMSGIGLMERAERAILILVGMVLWFIYNESLNYVLVLGLLLNSVTIVQRAWKIVSSLR